MGATLTGCHTTSVKDKVNRNDFMGLKIVRVAFKSSVDIFYSSD